MPLTNLKTVLEKARGAGYAVGAFNLLDGYFLDAIVSAARELASPVIVNIAESHFAYMDVEAMAAAVRARAAREQVDVVLHLDHGQSLQSVRRVVACGFTSVMFDGSRLPLAENIHQTRQIVELCHPLDVSVEAELGMVGGAEGEQGGTANPDRYTNVDEARAFVRETGIDALAVAIGNVHGAYRGAPKLNFERLAAIRDAANLPLVLHGGTGIPEEDFRRAVSLGICKVNFFTGLSSAALEAVRENFKPDAEKGADYPTMMLAMKLRLGEVVKANMHVFGCAGQAAR